MKTVAVGLAAFIVAACGSSTEPDQRIADTGVGEKRIGDKSTAEKFINPCPAGLCTPVGGGDMHVGPFPEAGVPTTCGHPYPMECAADLQCAGNKLCGGVAGTVRLPSCTYSCAYP